MSIIFFFAFWNHIILAGWELRLAVIVLPLSVFCVWSSEYIIKLLLLEYLRIAYLEENGKSSILLFFPHLSDKGPSLMSSSADGLSALRVMARVYPTSLKCLNTGWFSLCLQWQPFIWLYFVHGLQNLKVYAPCFCSFVYFLFSFFKMILRQASSLSLVDLL